MRLKGLVEVQQEKLNHYNEIVVEWIISNNRTTAEIEFSQKLYELEEEIEYWKNPKNF